MRAGTLLLFAVVGISAFAQVHQWNQPVPPSMQGLWRRAQQGDVAAQRKLGEAFSEGARVARDDAESAYWLRKAGD
ncbi:MAG: hypothetical protein ACXVZV_11955, partial [Terriglobales bacterium]